MHFCVQTRREDRKAEELRVLHLSLNTPVVAIDELPVGPARAGIALFEAPEGALRLEIAVRSLRVGQVVSYAPDEALDGARDAIVAVDAALSFAEGMGFLFDEDEVAAGAEAGTDAAAALWRDVVEEISLRTHEPEAAAPARPRAEETAPVLDLVREVPVRDGESGPERVDIGDGEEVVLSDINVVAEAAVDAMVAPELVLSKFRLVIGAREPGGFSDDASRDGEGATGPVAPQDLRIRLLSRF
jgi:hypothetical protein